MARDPLLIRPATVSGSAVITRVTAAEAGWPYLNMEVRRLQPGESWAADAGDNEYLHVVLSGSCRLRAAGLTPMEGLHIEGRSSVFSGLPHAAYLGRRTAFEFAVPGAAKVPLEIASCWVPTDCDFPARFIPPAEVEIELRGGGPASRQINRILPPGFACHRLTCQEVLTPGGNWSSYPGHKHDVHRADAEGRLIEADLDEIYFFKVDRPQGYAFQFNYNDDRSLERVLVCRDNDAVCIYEGYHPVASPPGYTTYYLNFLAGSAQSLAALDDPQQQWIKGTWTDPDPRVPLFR